MKVNSINSLSITNRTVNRPQQRPLVQTASCDTVSFKGEYFKTEYYQAYKKVLKIQPKTIADCEKIFNMLKETILKEPNIGISPYLNLFRLPFLNAVNAISNRGDYEKIPLIQEPTEDEPLAYIKNNKIVFTRTNLRTQEENNIEFSVSDKDLVVRIPHNNAQIEYKFWGSTGNLKEIYNPYDGITYYNKDGKKSLWRNILYPRARGGIITPY